MPFFFPTIKAHFQNRQILTARFTFGNCFFFFHNATEEISFPALLPHSFRGAHCSHATGRCQDVQVAATVLKQLRHDWCQPCQPSLNPTRFLAAGRYTRLSTHSMLTHPIKQRCKRLQQLDAPQLCCTLSMSSLLWLLHLRAYDLRNSQRMRLGSCESRSHCKSPGPQISVHLLS